MAAETPLLKQGFLNLLHRCKAIFLLSNLNYAMVFSRLFIGISRLVSDPVISFKDNILKTVTIKIPVN